MSLERAVCVNCKYEDASNTLHSTAPNYPGIEGEAGYAIWCKKLERYIGGYDRQGIKRKPDGTNEENIWCRNFEHY